MSGAGRSAVRAGQVFTPAPLADALWERALDAIRPEPGALIRAVDPAAGDGALVDAAARAGARHRVAIDVVAVELDRALNAALATRLPDATCVHADALTLSFGPSAPPSPLGRAEGVVPPAEILGPARALLYTGWADVVVANPPYLRETSHRDVIGSIRRWNGGALRWVYRKDADLHFFFWAVAMRWLRPGGVLAFVTPAYYLESSSARSLRQALEERGRLLGVWRAGAARAFGGVGVEAAVTVWQKRAAPEDLAELLNADARADLELPVLDAPDARPARTVLLLRRAAGDPWWLSAEPEAPDAASAPLGALYDIVEGVSTGANRLRAEAAARAPGAAPGCGIFMLTPQELAAAELDPSDPLVARRYPLEPERYLLRVPDHALPRLDAELSPQTPIERHLARFEAVLRARAEMARNPRRSWYACAWTRAELDVPGALVTPKWSAAARFAPLAPGTVPMTDHRVLVPRSPRVAAARDRVCAWLNGAATAAWAAARLKHKGGVLEWYGPTLDALPVPEHLLD